MRSDPFDAGQLYYQNTGHSHSLFGSFRSLDQYFAFQDILLSLAVPVWYLLYIYLTDGMPLYRLNALIIRL